MIVSQFLYANVLTLVWVAVVINEINNKVVIHLLNTIKS